MKKILYLSLFAFLISFNGYSQCNIIYVTPNASPTGAGTIASPKSIEAAFAAATEGTTIRLSAGLYEIDKTLEIPANNVIIDGGFSSDFSRKNETIPYYSPETVINRRAGSPLNDAPGIINYLFIKIFIAIRGEDKSGFEIRDITIHTEDIIYDNYLNSIYKTSNNSVTNYGIYLFRCSNYKIVNTSIKVGSGGDGKEEPFGADGENGKNGLEGGGGSCDDELAPGIGGIGGSAVYSFLKNYGGYGGTGGYEVSGQYNGKVGGDGATGDGPLDGDGGKGATVVGLYGSYPENKYYTDFNGNFGPVMEGSNGEDGKEGLDGDDGTLNPTMNTTTTIYYFPSQGTDGQTGGDGGGGGGGSGGGMQNSTGVNNGAGNGGGGGGSGGTGGLGGNGATGGGGSFGIYTYGNGGGSQIINCTIEVSEPAKAGLPGEGGDGGRGGFYGNGGNTCIDEVGAGGAGGRGGDGGNGGKGGTALDGISEKIINNGAALEIQNDVELAPMTISCAEDIFVDCTEPVVLEKPQTSEPCFSGSITNNAPSKFPNGTTVVTWTVIDYYGNVLTCEQKVTVLPVAFCKDIVVYLDHDGEASVRGSDLDGGSCGTDYFTASKRSFTCEDIGHNTIIMTAFNESGNSSTCTSVVSVSDLISPVAVCKDTAISLVNGVASIMGDDLDGGSTDNCGIVIKEISKSDFTVADLGSNTIILTVWDGTGYPSSCEAVVRIGDFTAPEVICNSIDIKLDENGSYKLTAEDMINLSAGTTDNMDEYGDLVFTASPDTFSCANLGLETIVELTATDIAGNSSTCTTIVNVLDTMALEINAVEDVIMELEFGICETKITYPEIVTNNNCATISQVSGLGVDGVFPIGTSTETWMATNTNGDTVEISFNVIVSSVNSLPTMDAVDDVSVNEGVETVDVILTGLSFGNDCESQELAVSVSGWSSVLITDITVDYISPDSTGILHLILAPEMSGMDTITVTVSDGTDTVYETFVLTVNPADDPFEGPPANTTPDDQIPVVVRPIADQVVNASYELRIPVNLTPLVDKEGKLLYTILTNGIETLPSWISVINDSLEIAPTLADTGCVTVVIKAIEMEGVAIAAADTFRLCVEGFAVSNSDFNTTAFDVQMYPNPTRGEVSLNINAAEIMDSEVIVRSISGSEVFRKTYKATQQIKIDLSEKVSGMYLVTVNTGNRTVDKKLILDKK